MSGLKRDDLHVLMTREYIAGLQLGYKLGLEKDFRQYQSIVLARLKDIEAFEQPPFHDKGQFARTDGAEGPFYPGVTPDEARQ